MEHELAEEDKARASRAGIWVHSLEEVPPEVLQDAIEQQRDYLRRVRERAGEITAGQPHVPPPLRFLARQGGAQPYSAHVLSNWGQFDSRVA